MLSIKLIINGKEKEFKARGVTLRTSYLAYELYKEYDLAGGMYNPDLLDRIEAFICACFGGAFTQEQLLDGYQGSAFVLYPGILNAVVGYSNDKIANFPPPATTREKAAATN